MIHTPWIRVLASSIPVGPRFPGTGPTLPSSLGGEGTGIGVPVPAGTPWSFHLHPWAWASIVVAIALALVSIHRARRALPEAGSFSRRSTLLAVTGFLSLAVALTWPVADLAHSWSLLGRIVQDILLCLAAPGFLLAGTPRWLASQLTRLRAVQVAVHAVTGPFVAIALFNVIVIGTQLPPVVRLQSGSWAAQGAGDLLLFCAGLVLWAPVLRSIPGTRALTTGWRVGYLFGQSLLPNFLSLVYIFARRPLYAVYGAHARALGISAIGDQQLAGAVAKVVGVFVLWGAAVTILFRSSRAQEQGKDPDPLVWEDVERELKRLEGRKTPKEGV